MSTYESANDAEHTVEEETDSGNDLEERLRQKTPERVELLLRMWHAFDFALRVVNGLGHVAGELEKKVSIGISSRHECVHTSFSTSAR